MRGYSKIVGAPVATRVAVLGLYNSGSSGVAELLYRLGVNMGGPPFWKTFEKGVEKNHYEPYELAWHLRKWWAEPTGVESTAASQRVSYLKCWAEFQGCLRAGPVGAKHPLLSLCGNDIAGAWGPDTRFVWSWRPLEESIVKLKERGWFQAYAEPLQQKLWQTLERFEVGRKDFLKLDWNVVKSDPVQAARDLAFLAGLSPSEAELKAAAECITV